MTLALRTIPADPGEVPLATGESSSLTLEELEQQQQQQESLAGFEGFRL